jgi:hypothetical protein
MGEMTKMRETESIWSAEPARNGDTTAASQAEGEEIGLLGAFLSFCAVAALSLGTILFIIVMR